MSHYWQKFLTWFDGPRGNSRGNCLLYNFWKSYLRSSIENLLDFWRFFPAGLSTLHFTCPEEILQEVLFPPTVWILKNIFGRKHLYPKFRRKMSTCLSKLHFMFPEKIFEVIILEKSFLFPTFLGFKESFCRILGKSF